MKKIIIAMFALLLCIGASAQSADGLKEGDPQVQTQKEVMYKIIKDETLDGVRYVTAVPSEKVCSKQIDITIKDGIIDSVKFTRGCPGNALGIGALIKGMSVEEAIKRLDGIQCGSRGTSCPDQLAQVLKTLAD